MQISMWILLPFLLVLAGLFFISINQEKVVSIEALRKAWTFMALIPMTQGVLYFLQLFLLGSRSRSGISLSAKLQQLAMSWQLICLSLILIFLMNAMVRRPEKMW